uniref:Uncharacterized protein n=1 Tax=Oryza glumipatula TaxID=40148 RepID=A0A0D9Y7H3_9ORYZ
MTFSAVAAAVALDDCGLSVSARFSARRRQIRQRWTPAVALGVAAAWEYGRKRISSAAVRLVTDDFESPVTGEGPLESQIELIKITLDPISNPLRPEPSRRLHPNSIAFTSPSASLAPPSPPQLPLTRRRRLVLHLRTPDVITCDGPPFAPDRGASIGSKWWSGTGDNLPVMGLGPWPHLLRPPVKAVTCKAIRDETLYPVTDEKIWRSDFA